MIDFDPNLLYINMSMRRANEDRAKRIIQYYERHDKDKKRTYVHFMDEGLNKKTVYHILRRHEERGDITFRKPTGRRSTVCTPEMFERLANLFKESPKLSCREAAEQLGIARTTIFRIMRKMKEKDIETNKVIESEPRCPTCHQKVDMKRKRKKKVNVIPNDTEIHTNSDIDVKSIKCQPDDSK